MFYASGVLCGEGFPRAGFVLGLALPVEVAQSHRQCIGGIEHKGLCLLKVEQAHKHSGNLCFGGVSFARNHHFYFLRGIFYNRNFARECCRHAHALRPAKFEHRLYVFSVKRCFQGHFIGVVIVDNLQQTVKYFLQFVRMIFVFRQVNYAILQQNWCFCSGYFYQTVACGLCAGVYTQNYFFLQRLWRLVSVYYWFASSAFILACAVFLTLLFLL